MERLRDLGLRIGDLEVGPRDAITDVGGVSVGQVTVRRDEPDPPAYRPGSARPVFPQQQEPARTSAFPAHAQDESP